MRLEPQNQVNRLRGGANMGRSSRSESEISAPNIRPVGDKLKNSLPKTKNLRNVTLIQTSRFSSFYPRAKSAFLHSQSCSTPIASFQTTCSFFSYVTENGILFPLGPEHLKSTVYFVFESTIAMKNTLKISNPPILAAIGHRDHPPSGTVKSPLPS